MENLITITPEKNIAGKDCLRVELTIDGATAIEEAGLGEMAQLWENLSADYADTYTLSSDGKTISTTEIVAWEDEPLQTVNEFKTDKSAIDVWLQNPKEQIIFLADPQNSERAKEVTAKLAAGMWAVYCNQKLCDALLETNNRYNTLKIFYEKMMEAAKVLKYDNFKQDDKYYEFVKSCLTEAEKEMDFHLQKVNLIRAVSKNDYYSVTPVNELYRAFRGVNEAENKSKINVTSDVDENNDSIIQKSNEEYGNKDPQETKRPDDTQRESGLRVV